ncbi:MAG: pyruvate, phosphate dikinase [Magnetovibrio sp.]|nr:pyruvate, phosphate dikinase [Magnetovibrio sp.]
MASKQFNTNRVTSDSFQFGTKGETLERLRGLVTKGYLCDQIIIHENTWSHSRPSLVSNICQKFSAKKLILRSSAKAEDSWGQSLAGAYLSVLDVSASPAAVSNAIDRVFESYTKKSSDEQVLVQPMVESVAISGVVLTRDLDTGSPYFVVNYDDHSGKTDSVTGGRESTAVLVRRNKQDSLRSLRLKKLIDCVIELELITNVEELDIEFCIDSNNKLFILQVRPLAARNKWHSLSDGDVNNAITVIQKNLDAFLKPFPGLSGKTTIFTEMSDWNPAEMIGNTPRPLALSLYQSLITNRVWAMARNLMGYRMVKGPLLIDFRGRPFIDVRKSFNSFLPADTKNAVAEKLVNYQLNKLAQNRELHDKVEFEICITCWDFSENRSFKRLADAGLSKEESQDFRNRLINLTEKALTTKKKGLNTLLDKTNELFHENKDLSALPPLEKIYYLLKDCREKGTLIFSQLARHGFIGIQFLSSLIKRGALNEQDLENFMGGINTITKSLSSDLQLVANKNMTQTTFLDRYGHLRPGTYDILSWRYDEKPELYLHFQNKPLRIKPETSFHIAPKKKRDIQLLLKEIGYSLTADQLLDYIASSIKGREQAKFAFTRVISDILSTLTVWGNNVGLSRDDLSYLPIGLMKSDVSISSLEKKIKEQQEKFNVTRAIQLPHVIISGSDLDIVRLPLGQPTFITSKAITAKTKMLGSNSSPNIDGHIILIESADPGFDWIFSHNIVGLITKYGGANSHMAIRCAEFGLPAAIGCGERLFNKLARANTVELNAASKKLGRH